MRFEWSESKNSANYKKHGVLFETAALVFDDPDALMAPDREVDGEERWHTVGLAEGLLLLLVVHTLRDEDENEVIRIISARKPTAHERNRYEDKR